MRRVESTKSLPHSWQVNLFRLADPPPPAAPGDPPGPPPSSLSGWAARTCRRRLCRLEKVRPQSSHPVAPAASCPAASSSPDSWRDSWLAQNLTLRNPFPQYLQFKLLFRNHFPGCLFLLFHLHSYVSLRECVSLLCSTRAYSDMSFLSHLSQE